MNAWNRPAALTSGAWNPPASRASSTSRGGTSARASTSLRREHAVAEHAALHHEVRVALGEVAQRLGRGDGVAAVLADERDRDRTLELLDELVEAGVGRGPAGERVLEDLVVGRRRAQRGPQVGDLGDGQAAVLGEHGGVGALEPRP